MKSLFKVLLVKCIFLSFFSCNIFTDSDDESTSLTTNESTTIKTLRSTLMEH